MRINRFNENIVMVDDIKDIVTDLLLDLRDEYTEYEFEVNMEVKYRNQHIYVSATKRIGDISKIIYKSTDGYPGDVVSEHFLTLNALCKSVWGVAEILRQMPEFKNDFTFSAKESVGFVIYISENIKLHKRAGED